MYINNLGAKAISAMINLDICGCGDTIAVYAKEQEANRDFINMFAPSVLEKHAVNLVNYMPGGDDVAFDNAGIPNISIAVLPKNDIGLFNDFYNKYLNQENMPQQEESMRFLSKAEVMQTMHNGEKDCIDSVSQKPIDKLAAYLFDGLILT